MELIDNKNCFVCGKENKIGLKLDYEIEDRKFKAEFIPKPELQGFKDIVHGGIVTTLLDEAMVNLAYKLKLNAVTKTITVNLKKPTVVGHKYNLSGEIVEEQEKIIKAKATLKDQNNELVAEAESILVKLK
ncbi:MAG: PaaI family thioesterase [Candidatus Woesearchaeota archaeon]|nr:PaaI family thioesterase [Candidatus Woesearchaeota archaeon]